MDNEEAQAILESHLSSYRLRSYRELTELIGQSDTCEVTTPSGRQYQLEVSAVWDSVPSGNVRIIGSIDDEGGTAFKPLASSFIVAPEGTYVGEGRTLGQKVWDERLARLKAAVESSPRDAAVHDGLIAVGSGAKPSVGAIG